MQKPFNVQIFATILNSACSLRIFTKWEWPASNPEPLRCLRSQKSWALGTTQRATTCPRTQWAACDATKQRRAPFFPPYPFAYKSCCPNHLSCRVQSPLSADLFRYPVPVIKKKRFRFDRSLKVLTTPKVHGSQLCFATAQVLNADPNYIYCIMVTVTPDCPILEPKHTFKYQ